jgi:hypothetical protein
MKHKHGMLISMRRHYKALMYPVVTDTPGMSTMHNIIGVIEELHYIFVNLYLVVAY